MSISKDDKRTIDRNYKSIAICEYNNRISRLRKEKLEFMKKTVELQNNINNIQNIKQQFCSEVLDGHVFREEVENGLYGDRYSVCITCGLEV